jgi:hypothetical protein
LFFPHPNPKWVVVVVFGRLFLCQEGVQCTASRCGSSVGCR